MLTVPSLAQAQYELFHPLHCVPGRMGVLLHFIVLEVDQSLYHEAHARSVLKDEERTMET
jgi:hypothetical protein